MPFGKSTLNMPIWYQHIMGEVNIRFNILWKIPVIGCIFRLHELFGARKVFIIGTQWNFVSLLLANLSGWCAACCTLDNGSALNIIVILRYLIILLHSVVYRDSYVWIIKWQILLGFRLACKNDEFIEQIHPAQLYLPRTTLLIVCRVSAWKLTYIMFSLCIRVYRISTKSPNPYGT